MRLRRVAAIRLAAPVPLPLAAMLLFRAEPFRARARGNDRTADRTDQAAAGLRPVAHGKEGSDR
jgi:hypothetical protein